MKQKVKDNKNDYFAIVAITAIVVIFAIYFMVVNSSINTTKMNEIQEANLAGQAYGWDDWDEDWNTYASGDWIPQPVMDNFVMPVGDTVCDSWECIIKVIPEAETARKTCMECWDKTCVYVECKYDATKEYLSELDYFDSELDSYSENPAPGTCEIDDDTCGRCNLNMDYQCTLLSNQGQERCAYLNLGSCWDKETIYLTTGLDLTS